MARRRGRQDREPADRRPRPPPQARQDRRRPLVFPPVQRQQEVADPQPQIAARPRNRQVAAETGRRHGREHGAGHDRAPRAQLRRSEEDQPRHHLLPGQGLRHRQPLREIARLRHDRAGCRRHVQRHRLRRPAAGQARPQLRRYRHRHADGDQHSGRPLQAAEDRPGPPPRSRDAGRDDPLHAGAVLAHPGERQGASARRLEQVEHGDWPRRRSTRARAAGRTITSMSSPAAATPTTGAAFSR